MSPELARFLQDCEQDFQQALPALCQPPGSDCPAVPGGLAEAGAYSLGNGGKRIRPVLCHAAAAALGAADRTRSAAPAHALELIHTYSLIHDDLPAMDDDDLRRGQPSLHRAYDEATAILVGDGLQARAFEVIAGSDVLDAAQKVAMIGVLARASGMQGMVGGQYIDIHATGTDMDLAALQAMHQLKTGALIRAALALGGIAAGASEAQLRALDDYGRHIGLAFQVVDDILDVDGDPSALGKTGGKDAAANKPTYVKLLGLDGARQEAQQLLQAALTALETFGASADRLRELARYIVERDR
ncbi:polyprenyl synthetase family protein [Mangrovimicrobium sediminis]|uniref:Polyprenyl synthetase family protein n=1 Tax=Mangrovimicrobium sediminis TaxID=2562682 RepID=A0A4Z0M8E8_9GAMM|nr:farnesyl diphosphate synthase [Haliea sp. SAOS-164]TGD75657.1 polyprenyl synthetase family protein [Haliea sp. SAOS-164]